MVAGPRSATAFGRFPLCLVLRLVAANQALLLRLVVAVLQEDRHQFEGVALGARSATRSFVDAIQFVPRPDVIGFQRFALHLALDDRGIDQGFLWAADDAGDVSGASSTHNLDGVIPIGSKPYRPQQSRGGHLGIHLAVAAAVLDLHLVVLLDPAGKLRCRARQFLAVVLAGYCFEELECLLACGAGLEVHGWDVGGFPHLCPCDGGVARILGCCPCSDGRGRDAHDQNKDKTRHKNILTTFSAISLPSRATVGGSRRLSTWVEQSGSSAGVRPADRS